MNQPTAAAAAVATHTHYVSNLNGVIYPAMTSPAGYEDAHPTEWRPATGAEIAAFKEGNDTTDTAPVDVTAALPTEATQPTSIRLTEEDGVAEAPVVALASIPPASIPPAPTGALQGE